MSKVAQPFSNRPDQYEVLFPGVFRWNQYSVEHRVELASHAVVLKKSLFIFDPIPLDLRAIKRLAMEARPAAIIVTNPMHERAAAAWATLLRIPVWAAHDTRIAVSGCYHLPARVSHWMGWSVRRLEGGSAPELIFLDQVRRLSVFGDAVIQIRDLELLPEKYCIDQATLRHQLRRLLLEPFEVALLGHGRPLLSQASAKIERLLPWPGGFDKV